MQRALRRGLHRSLKRFIKHPADKKSRRPAHRKRMAYEAGLDAGRGICRDALLPSFPSVMLLSLCISASCTAHSCRCQKPPVQSGWPFSQQIKWSLTQKFRRARSAPEKISFDIPPRFFGRRSIAKARLVFYHLPMELGSSSEMIGVIFPSRTRRTNSVASFGSNCFPLSRSISSSAYSTG